MLLKNNLDFLNLRYLYIITLISLLSLFGNTANAQGVIIKGIVTDFHNKSPLSSATVRIGKSDLKTKTDINGFFSIQVNSLSKEILIISSIGYKTNKILLSNYQVDTTLKIELKSSTFELNEVVISSNSAEAIVEKAFINIPFNYPNKDTFYEGFYRESSLMFSPSGNKQGTDYIIESVLDMKKGTYEKAKSVDEIKLRNIKKAISIDSGVRRRWLGGILSPSKLDVVKKRVEFLNPKFKNEYKYKRLKDTVIYNKPTYTIVFEPRNRADYSGVLYIDIETFAFIEINYKLTKQGLKHHYFFLVVKPEVKEGVFKVNYFPINSRWFLNNIYQKAVISMANNIDYNYINEFITIKIDTGKGDFYNENKNEKMGFWGFLPNVAMKTDTVFWKNYTLKSSLIGNRQGIYIDTTIKALEVKKQVGNTNTKGYLVTPHLHKIITDGFVKYGYQYERAIGKTKTLLLHTGIFSPNFKNVYPFIEVSYRNYYNLQKRFNQEKRTWNNSANYFGVKIVLSGKDKLFAFGYSDNKVYPYIILSPVWGIQRQISKHFGYNYYIGPIITNQTFSNTVKKSISDFVDFGGSLSYSF